MPRIEYISKRFHSKTLELIESANDIIDEYQEQGLDLTVRQLFYQFVSRDLIPNTEKWYGKIAKTINDARLAGLIDWNAIVDRTRSVHSFSYWKNPREIVKAVTEQYKIDKWAVQPYYPEVWIEKDALIGVIAGVCEEFEVPFFACRGYNSQSNMWEAGAIRLASRPGTPVILYLGDHDPSGLDMSRDIESRLNLFGADCEVKRLALNIHQIKQSKSPPPPNPTKITDTRAKSYIDQFGPESWELDAMDPSVIVDLIRLELEEWRDDDLWAKALEKEEKDKKYLSTLIKLKKRKREYE